MIKVPPDFYRFLWIAVAVIGAICFVGGILIFFGDDSLTVISGGPSLAVAAVFGGFVLVYALWRLIWPLKAPPRE